MDYQAKVTSVTLGVAVLAVALVLARGMNVERHVPNLSSYLPPETVFAVDIPREYRLVWQDRMFAASALVHGVGVSSDDEWSRLEQHAAHPIGRVVWFSASSEASSRGLLIRFSQPLTKQEQEAIAPLTGSSWLTGTVQPRFLDRMSLLFSPEGANAGSGNDVFSGNFQDAGVRIYVSEFEARKLASDATLSDADREILGSLVPEGTGALRLGVDRSGDMLRLLRIRMPAGQDTTLPLAGFRIPDDTEFVVSGNFFRQTSTDANVSGQLSELRERVMGIFAGDYFADPASVASFLESSPLISATGDDWLITANADVGLNPLASELLASFGARISEERLADGTAYREYVRGRATSTTEMAAGGAVLTVWRPGGTRSGQGPYLYAGKTVSFAFLTNSRKLADLQLNPEVSQGSAEKTVTACLGLTVDKLHQFLAIFSHKNSIAGSKTTPGKVNSMIFGSGESEDIHCFR